MTNRNDYTYGQITVRAYTGPLKYAVTKSDMGKLVAGYINASKKNRLIECMYNPYTKSIYITDAMYLQNKESIDEALSNNMFAVVTRERGRLDADKSKWETELTDMGIEKRYLSDFIKVLKDSSVSYGNLLDYHIRGVEFCYSRGDYCIVNCGEDKWKVMLNKKNDVELYHNSYQIMPDGSRIIARPIKYHLHGSYASMKQVLYIITNYSYEWHKIMGQENLVQSDPVIKAYIRIKTAIKRQKPQ
ncbi:MAG: hypothetical protein MJ059_02630 [Lachnospiraceae bacterium]|nr:hypothetical protein [Lachnospiraceae bacterium]